MYATIEVNMSNNYYLSGCPCPFIKIENRLHITSDTSYHSVIYLYFT